jgi:hypothetical protein
MWLLPVVLARRQFESDKRAGSSLIAYLSQTEKKKIDKHGEQIRKAEVE